MTKEMTPDQMFSATDKSKKIAQMWKILQEDALRLREEDSYISNFIETRILSHNDMASCLSQVLALQIGEHNFPHAQIQTSLNKVFTENEDIVFEAVCDLEANLDRDPACTSPVEPLLLFKGFQALQAHRVAHFLWKQGRTFLSKIIQSSISRAFGVDIHPAAKVGCGIMFDHATNIVVGETATIGHNVSILHGVTLGGTGKVTGDRHPKIGNGVLIGAHAQLIGNIRIGDNAKIGAGAVVLNDVPKHTTWAGVPAKQVGTPSCDVPALDMSQQFYEI